MREALLERAVAAERARCVAWAVWANTYEIDEYAATLAGIESGAPAPKEG